LRQVTHKMPSSILEVEVAVEVPFRSTAEAKSAMRALVPDNVNFPKGLSLKLFSSGAKIVIELRSKNIAAGTVVSTLDEVLEHISLVKRVMNG